MYPSPSHRTLLASILFIVSLTAGVFLSQDMWVDEYRTLFYAGAVPQYGPTTFQESVDRIATNLWQAPAYYMVIWGWGHVFGWSTFALRLPSLLFGLLTIILTYDLALQSASKKVAFYAAFLLAFGAFFLNFLHDMRAYTLFTALTTLMIWSYMRLTHSKNTSLRFLPLLIVSTTALLYTHFFSVFPIAALGLCHLLLKRKHRVFWPIIFAFALSGILFLPWLQVLLGGAQLATEVPRRVLNLSAIEIVHSILYFFTNGGAPLGLIVLIFALLARRGQSQTLFMVWLFVSGILLWGVTRFVPAITDVKYMLFLWPVLAVVFANGIQHLSERGIRPVFILAVWALMFGYSLLNQEEQTRIHPWYRPPFIELADRLKPMTTTGDAVLFVDPNQEGYVDNSQLSYYFYDTPVQQTEVIRDGFATNDQAFMEQAQTGIQNAQRVWLTYDLQSPNWRTEFLTETTLPAAGFTACGTLTDSERVSIALFAHQPSDVKMYGFQTHGNTDIDTFLVSEPLMTQDKTASILVGSIVPPDLQEASYSLAVHLEDVQGQLVAQSDASVGQVGFNCSLRLIDMSDVPVGYYDIKSTVYNWQTGERLEGSFSSSDQRATIGSIDVSQ